MRLSQRQLRQLIESEVDKMRTPKGPNSRDDGDDKDLAEEDLAEGRLNKEIDPIYGIIGDWSNSLIDFVDHIDHDLMQNDGRVTTKTYEALDKISALVMKMNKFSLKMKSSS